MMKTYEALPTHLQIVARAMSDAARRSLRDAGIAPCNTDPAGRFEEACAVYLLASAPSADTGGWITHEVKPDSVRPTSLGARVDVRCRDGVELGCRAARTLRWNSSATMPEGDIVAWRPSV